MKFVADGMLGTLAKWLRVFGFDTVYVKDSDDRTITELALTEQRIILSKDRSLCSGNDASIMIESVDLDSQILQVLVIHRPDSAKLMTRCLECNSELQFAAKPEAMGNVPQDVWCRHSEFMKCPQCRKYYWHGSHWDNMAEKTAQLIKRAESQCLS